MEHGVSSAIGLLPSAAESTGGGSALGSFLPLLLIGVAFWFLILRPQRARARNVARVQAELAPGAEVVTTAGLYARVDRVEDDSVLLEIAPGVTSRYARAAVARVVSPVDRGVEEQTGSVEQPPAT